MLPARLLDWFHILRSVHQKEQWKLSGFELPKLGEVLPHLKIKEARMPFPSGRNLGEVHIHTWHPSHNRISLINDYLLTLNFCNCLFQAQAKQFVVNQYTLCSTMCWIKIQMVFWIRLSWQTFMRLEQSLA